MNEAILLVCKRAELLCFPVPPSHRNGLARVLLMIRERRCPRAQHEIAPKVISAREKLLTALFVVFLRAGARTAWPEAVSWGSSELHCARPPKRRWHLAHLLMSLLANIYDADNAFEEGSKRELAISSQCGSRDHGCHKIRLCYCPHLVLREGRYVVSMVYTDCKENTKI